MMTNDPILEEVYEILDHSGNVWETDLGEWWTTVGWFLDARKCPICQKFNVWTPRDARMMTQTEYNKQSWHDVFTLKLHVEAHGEIWYLFIMGES